MRCCRISASLKLIWVPKMNNSFIITDSKPLDKNIFFCLAKLYMEYGSLEWWPADTEWEMMAGAILTQNTAWTNVELALAKIKQAAGANNFTASWLLNQSAENIKNWIRPSGFFNQKTSRLIDLAQWFVSHGETAGKLKAMPLDQLRTELLAIKGVGPETCDSIVLYAAEKPVFLIDNYTRRWLDRLGYAIPRPYESLRMELESLVKTERPWLDSKLCLGTNAEVPWLQRAHGLIVEHCKNYCLKKPLCPDCSIYKNCEQQFRCKN